MIENQDNPIWSGGKKFAVCLTHDVDRVKKTYQYITHFAKTKDFYHIKSFFTRKYDPYWNFERIMEIEEKCGVRSTFFFLNESKKFNILRPDEWKLSLGRYNINVEKIIDIIQKLHAGGWEVGLHGSYESYKNKELLAEEKKILEEIVGGDVIGIRQHYLNLSIPETWEIQKDVGFKYDTSFGSSLEIGFREKRYLPFRPFTDSFLVIPLTMMDSVLFKNSKSIEDAWNRCKELIDQAEEHGAVLTVLWHQRVFNEQEFPNWSKIYEKIIEYCLNKNAWVTNSKEIERWWNNK